MSSDVQAKWTNSAPPSLKPAPANFSFRKYSTALTSWLMRRSISLMRATSSGPNRSTRNQVSAWSVDRSIGGNSPMAGSAPSVRNHSTSTRKRWRKNASSEKA